MPPVTVPSATQPLAGPRASRHSARPRRLAAAVLCVLVAMGCGKKGPPLAPLQRVPAKVAAWSAVRSDDTVFLSFTVPTANIGGDQPADVALVEIYAVTVTGVPPALENGRVPEGLTLVASAPVRRPLPPPPPPREGAPPLPPLPREPGLDQGVAVTFTETLTPALVEPAPLTAAAAVVAPPPAIDPATALSLPLSYLPPAASVRRHYAAVAVSRRGRRGAWSDWRSVPVAPAISAPAPPVVVFDEKAVGLSWTPPPGARVAPTPPADGALDSRPFGPPLTPTRYNVYAAGAAAVTPAGDLAPGAVRRPTPLTDKPMAAAQFAVPGAIVFDAETCFVVRPVDAIDGVDVEGPASAPGCVTPRDTFAPAAPTALEAVAGNGVISLIWDGVDTADLAGYLVFRGTVPGEPSTLLTPQPITAASFEDRTVTAGVRYVYMVVAVDSATPANRSAPSNRVEETAR